MREQVDLAAPETHLVENHLPEPEDLAVPETHLAENHLPEQEDLVGPETHLVENLLPEPEDLAGPETRLAENHWENHWREDLGLPKTKMGFEVNHSTAPLANGGVGGRRVDGQGVDD